MATNLKGMSLIHRVANVLGLRSEQSAPPTPLQPVDQARRERVVWTSPARASRVGTVFTCVSILCTAAEQLSVDIERNDVPIDSTPFIRRPDPALISRTAWTHQCVASLALHGNAYLRTWRSADGSVHTARVLNPQHVLPWIDDRTGLPRYSYQGKDLTTYDITHLKFMQLPGELRGLGPIQAAQAELSGHIDLTEASTSWLTTSGVPSGILTTEQSLTKEQRDELLQSWNSVPAGRTRLMSSGLQYKTYAINPRDAQFLESRRFSKTEIADMFGIPASLILGVDKGDSQTYSNVSQDWLGFVRFRLMRYIREIEEALTSLLPRGQQARFNMESLLRSDAETRMRIHAQAVEAGIYSAAHARDIERIPESAAPAPKEPAA